MEPLHHLLQRQLHRQLGGAERVPDALWPLLRAVSEAYQQFDEDRRMLERSLDLSSQELLQANRDMRAVFGLFPDLFYRLDAQGRILDCSTGTAGLQAFASRHLVGVNVGCIFPASVGQAFQRGLADVRVRAQAVAFEFEMTAGGHTRQFEASLLPLQDRHVIAFLRDITARRRAEEERLRLHTAIEQAAEAVIITDTAGLIQYANPAFEHITGYARTEVIGRNPNLMKSGRQGPEFYRVMWETLLAGQVWRGRFTNRRKDGTAFELEAAISPIRDEAGRVVNYVAVSSDVTRQASLEEQLRQAHKMEAIGRLAGGVAHDFNNLLTTILGNTDLLLQDLAAADPRHGNAQEIRAAAIRAAALTGRLLAFGRRQVLNPQVLRLDELITDLARMLGRMIGEDVALTLSLPKDTGSIRADPIQVEQVLMNLAVNARDAMAAGGRLAMTLANVDVAGERLTRHGTMPPGAYVRLSVSDTGDGMSAEVQAHLFEPFFTTKQPGKGTGLGLAMVYGIMEQSGGFIAVESAPGQGSTFELYFPRVEGAAPEPAPACDIRTDLRGAETILLVEDEYPIRKLARAVLQQYGYTVLDAPDGLRALEVAGRLHEPVHLLITDVIMPLMTGETLARRLAEVRPDTRVLYMSGYPDATIMEAGVLASGRNFLKKPFSSLDLVRMVRTALDAR